MASCIRMNKGTLTELFHWDILSLPLYDRRTIRVRRIKSLDYLCEHLKYANSQSQILFQGYSVAEHSGSSGVAMAPTEICPWLSAGISLLFVVT